MNSKAKAIINALSVVLVLMVNYYSQAFGINGNSVGGLSGEYANLFTPAGYAFAIWGIIFLLLIGYVVFQIRAIFFNGKYYHEYEQTGWWFAVVNVLNATWVIVWLYEWTGVSVLVMAAMLYGLVRIVVNTNMERWDAPLQVIAFIWWPICIYAGWIAVAMIANVSALLAKVGWDGAGLSEVSWTIIMIVIATLVNLSMIVMRNMREFALVGVWALIAIYSRHTGSLDSIATTALVGAILLSVAVTVHGFINRRTNPFAKLMG